MTATPNPTTPSVLTPETLRAATKRRRAAKLLRASDATLYDAHADAWGDDLIRADVYDENYQKEYAAHAETRRRLEAAEAIVGEVAGAGVSFEDPRLDYAEVQIPQFALREAKAYMAALAVKEKP